MSTNESLISTDRLLRSRLAARVPVLDVGIAGAVAAASIISSVTFGVIPAVDPIGVGGAALFVIGVASVASLLPARRALGVDPMTTLRHE